jgi:4-amino-4-deoxy-L-arabinose transferase-like glycosyltransferase
MALYGGDDGWWWGAMAGKTIMACYSLIAAAALVAFGRRLHSLAAGVIAAVLYLSIPWTSSIAVTGYNEGPVALYAVLAIYALWLAYQNIPVSGRREPPGDAAPPINRLLTLSGFCAGSAVACKYPPLLFLVVPLLVFIAGIRCFEHVGSLVPGHWSFAPASGRDSRTTLQSTAVFLLAASLACGPWFLKNWALTSNPTYPLLYSAFDGRTRTPQKHLQWQRAHSPQPDSTGSRFSPQSFFREIAWNTWRSLWVSLAIPPLVVIAWLARPHQKFLAGLALWAAFVFITWWLLTHRLDRFLVLLTPLAALAAALGVFAIPHRAWHTATLVFVGIAALIHFPLVALHPDNRYFAPLERLRRDDRDLGEAGVRIEAAHRWLNERAKSGEKVLLVGDAEPFDLELPAIYNTCFDDCQFTRLFKNRTRAERLAALREENIAYVFFSWAHLTRYRSPGNYGYTSDYPTPELVHEELIEAQRLLIPIPLESEQSAGELFRVADE